MSEFDGNKKGSANWLAWILQYIVGIFAGVIAALYLVSEVGINFMRSENEIIAILLVIAGFALAFGGMASLLGDSFWVGENYRLFPPDIPSHNCLSKVLSWISILFGGAFLVGALGIYLYPWVKML